MKLLKILKRLEKFMANYLMKITEKIQSVYEKTEDFITSSNSTLEKHLMNYYNFNFENSLQPLNCLDLIHFYEKPERFINEKIAGLVPTLIPAQKGSENIRPEKSKLKASFESKISSANLLSPQRQGTMTKITSFKTPVNDLTENEEIPKEEKASSSMGYYQTYKGKENFKDFKFGNWLAKLEKKYEKLISLQTNFMESVKVKKQAQRMLKKHIKKQLKKMNELTHELDDIGYNALDLPAQIELDQKFQSDDNDENENVVRTDQSNLSLADNRNESKRNYSENEFIAQAKENGNVRSDSQKKSGAKAQFSLPAKDERKSAKNNEDDDVVSDVSLEGFETSEMKRMKISDKPRQEAIEADFKESARIEYQPGKIRPRSAKESSRASQFEVKPRTRPSTANGTSGKSSSTLAPRSELSPGKKRPISPYLLPPWKIQNVDLYENIYLIDKKNTKPERHKYSHVDPHFTGDFSDYEKVLLQNAKLNSNFPEQLRILNEKSHSKQYHIYRGVSLRYHKHQVLYNSNLIPDEEKQRMYKNQLFLDLKNNEIDESLPFVYDPNAENDGNLLANTNMKSSFKPVRMSVREMRSALKRGYTLSSMFNGEGKEDNPILRSASTQSQSPPKSIGSNPLRDKNTPLEATTIENFEQRRHSVKPVPNSLYAIQNISQYEKKEFMNLEAIQVNNFKDLKNYYEQISSDEEAKRKEAADKSNSEQILQNLFYHSAKPSKIAMTKDMIDLYGFSPKKAMEIFGPIPSYHHEKHAKLQSKEKKSQKSKSSKKMNKKSNSTKSFFSMQKNSSRTSENDDELHEILFGKKPKKKTPQKSKPIQSGSTSSLPSAALEKEKSTATAQPQITVEEELKKVNLSNLEKSPSSSPPKQVTWNTEPSLEQSDEKAAEEENEEPNYQFDYDFLYNDDEDEENNPPDDNQPAPADLKKEVPAEQEAEQGQKNEQFPSPAADSNPGEEKAPEPEFNLNYLKENSGKLMEAIFLLLRKRELVFDDPEEEEGASEGKRNSPNKSDSFDSDLLKNEAFQKLYDKYDQKLTHFLKIVRKQKEKIIQSLSPPPESANSFNYQEKEKEKVLTDIEYNEMQTELQDMSDLIFGLLPELMSLLNTFVIQPYLNVIFSKGFLINEIKFDLIIFFIKKCLNYTKLADNGVLTIPLDRTMQYNNPISFSDVLETEEKEHKKSKKLAHSSSTQAHLKTNKSKTELAASTQKSSSLAAIASAPIDHQEVHDEHEDHAALVPHEYHDTFISNNTLTSSGVLKSPFFPTIPQKHFVMTQNWDENSDKIRELLYYDASSQLKTSQLTKNITSEKKLEELIPHDSHHDYQYQLHSSNLTFHQRPFRTGSNPYSGFHPIGFHNKHSSIYHGQDLYNYNTSDYYEHLIESKNLSLQHMKSKNESLMKEALSSRPSSPKSPVRTMESHEEALTPNAPNSSSKKVIKQDALMPEKYNKTLENYLKAPTPVATMSYKQQQHDNLMLLNKNPQFLDNKLNNYFYLIHNLQKQIYQMLFNNLEMQVISSLVSFYMLLFHEFYYLVYQNYSLFIQENILKGKKSAYPKNLMEILHNFYNFDIFQEQRRVFFEKLMLQVSNAHDQHDGADGFFGLGSIRSQIHRLLSEKFSLQGSFFGESIDKLEALIADNLQAAKEFTHLMKKSE